MTSSIYTCNICNIEFASKNALGGHISGIHSSNRKSLRDKIAYDKRIKYESIIDINPGMFLDNKFTRWYYRIINHYRKIKISGYTEKHHVLPKSMGGSDDFDNIIKLPAKAHFVCHLLLTKMSKHNSENYFKAINAVIYMKADNTGNRYTSTSYDRIKKQYSIAQSINQSGNKNSQYGTCFMSNFYSKECKKVPLSEVDSYLSQGWVKKGVRDFSLFDKEGNKIKKNSHKSKYMRYAETNGPYELVSLTMFKHRSYIFSNIGLDFDSCDLFYEYRRIQLQLVFDHHYLSYRDIREKYCLKSDQTITKLFRIFRIT